MRFSYGYANTRPVAAIGVLQTSVSPIAKPNVSETISAPGYNLSTDNESVSSPFSQTTRPGSIKLSV